MTEEEIARLIAEGKMPHEWIQFHNLTCCARCGVVQRADGKNKPCKGPVKITLRVEKGLGKSGRQKGDI